MVQIIPRDDPWADAFRSLGKGAVTGYTQRADETAIQKAIADLGPNAGARDVLNVLTNTKTYSPEAKQKALQNFIGVEQFEELKRKSREAEAIAKTKAQIERDKLEKDKTDKLAERNKVGSIVDKLNIPDDQKATLKENLSLKTAEDLLTKQLFPKEGKQTPFEKKVQEKQADEYIKLNDEIGKLESQTQNIADAQKLSDELGLIGTAKGFFNLSEKAEELKDLSFTLMEPIVKIFNPSGPIAQQKLKMIQEKYTIKPSDLPWIRNAKLKVLKRFNDQAIARAKQKLKLIEQYNGNLPKDVADTFEKESDTMSNAMIDYDLVGEEIDLPVDPKNFAGKIITSPEGIKYRSDGTRWTKVTQ